MKIAHVAVWTASLTEMRDFYVEYFGGTASEKYVNSSKGFESCFVRFGDGTSLEIMSRTDVTERHSGEYLGYCHIAFDAGSPEKVVEFTERLMAAGITVAGEPRTTGDGFFESVVLDPDGNRIEIICRK